MTVVDQTTPDPAATTGETRPFETLMAVEGRWTGDERIIMVDGLSWDGLLPMCLTVDHEGVDEIVGRIDEMERMPGVSADERFIFGRGVIDLGSERGQETARLIEGQYLKGVSIEPDAIKEGGIDPEDPAGQDMYWPLVMESARVRALSIVTVPAFAEAYITFDQVSLLNLPPAIDGPVPLPADEVPEVVDEGIDEVIIVAAAGHTIAIPRVPPAEWFDEPTDVAIEGALTVTDEGRVFGLLAPANTPFIGDPSIRGVPMGNVDYSRFMRGEAFVDRNGVIERHVAGNITMGCGHTKAGTSAAAVMEHHENSCSVVAQVAVGERWKAPAGVWVAGALMPGVTADQVQRMMACQLSGEWHPTTGFGYELLASLLVPVPAFAMGRRSAYVSTRDGKLAASAIPVAFEDGPCEDCGGGGDDDAMSALERRVAALEASAGVLAPVALTQLRQRIRPS